MKILIVSLLLALGLAAQQPPVRSLICEPTSASGTTYTCSGSPTLGAYTTGLRIQFKADVANTGAVTINVDSLGAKSLTKLAGGINTALAANDLRAGQYALAIYDGTQFQMLSQLGNAAAGSSGVGFAFNAGPFTSTNATTVVAAVQGPSPTTQTTTNWARIASNVPDSCTAQNLRVDLGGVNQGSGGTLDVTLYNGSSATALTCSVAVGSSTCTDLVHTVSLTGGDLISIRSANGSSTAATYTKASFQCK